MLMNAIREIEIEVTTQSEATDAMLIAWHRWGDSDRSGGYPTECPSCRGYTSSKQWRGTDVDADGNVYQTSPDAIVSHIGPKVDQAVNAMTSLHRLALAYQARALAIGSYAIRNPRLPQGDELADLIAEARAELWEAVMV